MTPPRIIFSTVLVCLGMVGSARSEDRFADTVYPLLDEYCFQCHEPGLSKGGIEFLHAEQPDDIQSMRSVWRSVVSQLRNRTMPPPDKPQPPDDQRRVAANWILDFLDETAPSLGPFAGNVTTRRLNRFEYNNTIADLVGVRFQFDETLPSDSGTGEGFNNSGESLFLQPMLMERYLEAAHQIVDRVIVSPRHRHRTEREDLHGGDTALVPIYVKDDYGITFRIQRPEEPVTVLVKVDGIVAHRVTVRPDEGPRDKDYIEKRVETGLSIGSHAITLTEANDSGPFELLEVRTLRREVNPDELQKTTHRALLGIEFDEAPEAPRALASERTQAFMARAFRRPVREAETEKFLRLYERAIDRGDAWEDAMKLTFRGVLIAPDFLFRVESEPESEAIQPITEHELATRLAYFLWATMPDEELMDLADRGELRRNLPAQTERLMNDERFLRATRDFVGQWLGTKDVGGKVQPTTAENRETYRPEVARDMREEVVLLFHHLFESDRPLTEFVESDYSFLTERLAEFYQVQKDVDDLPQADGVFRKVRFQYSSQQRGGVLGTGAVLALTSHHLETSPVLRGAWVFDRLVGDPVPPPPADVPDLPKKKKDEQGQIQTVRQTLSQHRDDPSCMACHQLIDPIGFALDNYDYLGRWRTEEFQRPINPHGELPGGHEFTGPNELKRTLMETQQASMIRNVTKKLLAYALGRSLMDRDDATLAELTTQLEENDLRSRALIHGIVQSQPFQGRQVVK